MKFTATATLLFIAVMLSACASKYRYLPKSDSESTRSQKPYTVYGKLYEPLSSSVGFVQEGIASSYGRDFHGRETSSGETFDMTALTAAHKTLPLGVYVKVEHRRTGKDVIVRVNDRGPFVGDRVIDLSEEAASRLGMLQEGLAPVRVTALGYKSNDTDSGFRQPKNYDKGSFAIQVGAFTVRENAYHYMDEIKKKYGKADVQESWVKHTRYYRVRLGRFDSLKLAQANRETYEQKGFKGCFVVAVD